MSRFNATVETPRTKTVNKAGGEGYKTTPELELVSTMLTSFVQDKFYESANGTVARLSAAMDKVDPEFAAKASIFARDRFNMRSITHVAAGELAPRVAGKPWAKDFYNAVVVRPDDMLEIASYTKAKKGVLLTSAMKKGFGQAFNKFDSYQLARYRAEDKDLSLVDLVNLVRPKADNPKTAEALAALVAGKLRQSRTFESKLSKAGQGVTNAAEKAEAKATAWAEVIPTLGYMALVKNLRNIMTDAPESLDLALKRLEDEKAIKHSRLLPFRYIMAGRELNKTNDPRTRDVIRSLSKALDIAVSNVPKFEGRTLIALDASSSMRSRYGFYGSLGKQQSKGGFSEMPPAEIGALFAAILAKANDADVMLFHGSASYLNINTLDSTTTITDNIVRQIGGGATNFASVLQTANKAYDRIIVLTDNESWQDANRQASLKAYRDKYDVNPHLYLFTLSDYGTILFPENQVYCVAGFSEKVFDVMELLESDRKALVNEVRKVKFK
jgi:hypothetical protein